MEKTEKKQKYKLEEIIECPKCKTRISVKVWDETLTPSVPAEKEQHIAVEKDTQTTLPKEDETPPEDAPSILPKDKKEEKTK